MKQCIALFITKGGSCVAQLLGYTTLWELELRGTHLYEYFISELRLSSYHHFSLHTDWSNTKTKLFKKKKNMIPCHCLTLITLCENK